MIYPCEADIVSFSKHIVQSLQPYAKASTVQLIFSSSIKKQALYYQPFLLSQSITQLICNIISLLPPKSKIIFSLLYDTNEENLQAEIENTGINLIRVNEVCSKTMYSFTGYPLLNGTLYRLVLPLVQQVTVSNQPVPASASGNSLPQFYKEVQKRLRSNFTQTEKLMATLEKNRPQEASFMQKINALIKANLENENFDTNVLCKSMSLSRTQLFRRVKTLIRQAPANYIKIMRLQRAKELLETTDFTVSEIVFKTGFQAVSHFTKIFKKQYGVSPSVFRHTNKPATNE